MNLIPDIYPEIFTSSAIVIGYLLIGDTTANEQNALGNWLMLVAQVLCTNAYFLQVQSDRGNLEKFGKSFTNTNNSSMSDLLNKMVNAFNKEINNLKK